MGPTRSWRSRTRNLGTAAAGRGGLCQRINRASRLCIRGEEVCEKGGGGIELVVQRAGTGFACL